MKLFYQKSGVKAFLNEQKERWAATGSQPLKVRRIRALASIARLFVDSRPLGALGEKSRSEKQVCVTRLDPLEESWQSGK